jgi:hypothetical protein
MMGDEHRQLALLQVRLAVICETIGRLRKESARPAFSITDIPADLPIDVTITALPPSNLHAVHSADARRSLTVARPDKLNLC